MALSYGSSGLQCVIVAFLDHTHFYIGMFLDDLYKNTQTNLAHKKCCQHGAWLIVAWKDSEISDHKLK